VVQLRKGKAKKNYFGPKNFLIPDDALAPELVLF